ncbi:MAG: acyltransferase [Euryarchaeota archaeon]|nr:acyltransferase [Euryarchaeota archaeon]
MRLAWIDALKGFGILLVVFAHYMLPQALDTYIFSFHMPLFFFVSGFVFNFVKYSESAANFIKRRFRSLIIPYFAFAVITLLFYFLLDELYTPEVVSFKIFGAGIFHIVYSIIFSQTTMISYNGPLWFLTCLFVTELFFFGLAKRYFWQPVKLGIWLIMAGIIGYLYSVYIPFRLPWNADVALTAVVFYGTGNLFRRLIDSRILLDSNENRSDSSCFRDPNSKFSNMYFRIENFVSVFFILVSLLYFAYLLKYPTDKINMSGLIYGEFFSFYFLAFSGIFTFVYILKKIGSVAILEYYGRNSLIVLALHFPMKDILIKLSSLIFDMGIDCFAYTTSFAVALTVLNLLGLMPVIFLINRYFPLLAGKRSYSKSFKSLKARSSNRIK